MIFVDAQTSATLAPMPQLIDAIEQAYKEDIKTPDRAVGNVPGGNGDRLLLMMPAFGPRGDGVVKFITFFPDNPVSGRETIQGSILAFDEWGTPEALLDGASITRLRTAATSALASKFLSRSDSARLAMVGTGSLAPVMAAAHCAVRPITHISIWGRNFQKARHTASVTRKQIGAQISVDAIEDLASAVGAADIVSSCTNSARPIIEGRWLRPGTFVDLVGSFSPVRRETDDDVVLRSRIFVDTLHGAFAEAGDIADPIARGILSSSDVKGELSDLVCRRCDGRLSPKDIILFKAVGTARADYATARLILRSMFKKIAGDSYP